MHYYACSAHHCRPGSAVRRATGRAFAIRKDPSGLSLSAALVMSLPAISSELTKQHLIDPELCIRCGTCEATCTQGAVSHDDVNYVVAADKCNFCMDCIAPCPTGSIDNWRLVAAPYALEDQLGWTELPVQE